MTIDHWRSGYPIFEQTFFCKTRIGLRNCMLDYVGKFYSILLYYKTRKSIPSNKSHLLSLGFQSLGPPLQSMATWTAPRWSSKAAGTTKWDMVPWGLDHPWISWNRCGKTCGFRRKLIYKWWIFLHLCQFRGRYLDAHPTWQLDWKPCYMNGDLR